MQPLPFADEKAISKGDAELLYLSKQLAQTEWQKVISIYNPLANVISESRIE